MILVLMNLFAGPAGGKGDTGVSGAVFWAPDVPPRGRYVIDCTIDPAAGLVEGRETITLTNTATRALHRLPLDWPAEKGRTLEVVVDGDPVRLLPSLGAAEGGPSTLLDLPRPLEPGHRVRLEIAFRRQLPQAGGSPRLTLTAWHPRLWWGFPTHDDFEVKLRVPAEYAVATTGALDPRSGCYCEQDVRSFGVFLGKGLEVLEARAGEMQVRCLHPPAAAECARLLVATAADVIGFYRERFGLYPYRSLTIVPGMDHPAGGYPVATGLVAVHGQERMADAPELHWRWITAHEIGHQLWGESVLERDSPGWLWVGLGIFADREYVRARGLSPDKHRGLLARYTDGVRQGLDTTVVRTPEQQETIDFDFNNVVIHGKGFAIVSALACVLGPETFDRAYRRCLREFRGRRLGAAEFRRVAEGESRQDLGWFFDQWVRSNAYLSYAIADSSCAKEGERYVSRITVKRLGTLNMPVPVEARFEDGSRQRRMTDRLLVTNELRFESSSPLKETQLDPDGELPLVVPPPGPTAAGLGRKIHNLPWTGAGDEALRVLEEARKLDLQDGDLWAKLGLLLYDGRNDAEALEAFRHAAEHASPQSAWAFAALVWQGHLLDLAGRREEALKCYREALAKAGGSVVHHGQYGISVDRKWAEERLEKPFERR